MSDEQSDFQAPDLEGAVPRHVAIVMDGNGRWAQARSQSRHLGHRAGARAVRQVVESSARAGIKALTLFVFSSENWRRPAGEVGMLMELLIRTLEKETPQLHKNRVRLRLIGERDQFSPRLQANIMAAENLTAANTGLQLNLAASYGGRWDIARAARRLAEEVANGERDPASIDEWVFGTYVCLAGLPAPDLFIRTGGEHRISNFLLWQLAYTELYFTEVLWPDFDVSEFEAALRWFAQRQRRFGMTSEQVERQGRA
ncbi:polyprenyl diphosphate synthase [Nitrococcus mobilis]|uniref:Ditrans,polycis-undecaprenyl-diphosphate synthase ((2E,6E)-farnesyl-diphosphate specific) n=1 Tax=Nitrococcus mobilis Nb-231 TaxID=314278 RepID=A4BS26_9GAMM|nr:polyprenyl diphosphate synthase [Nitrococcus mobilis]EAR21505.1 undecaprenyl diphosphate synthase [Nitrococcus mobilis Nb-231]